MPWLCHSILMCLSSWEGRDTNVWDLFIDRFLQCLLTYRVEPVRTRLQLGGEILSRGSRKCLTPSLGKEVSCQWPYIDNRWGRWREISAVGKADICMDLSHLQVANRTSSCLLRFFGPQLGWSDPINVFTKYWALCWPVGNIREEENNGVLTTDVQLGASPIL